MTRVRIDEAGRTCSLSSATTGQDSAGGFLLVAASKPGKTTSPAPAASYSRRWVATTY